MAAQDPQEFQPFVIGRQPHAQTAITPPHKRANQLTRRENAAITAGKHLITRADQIVILDKIHQRRGRVVAAEDGALA